MQKVTNIIRVVLLALAAIHIVLADSNYDVNIQVELHDDLVKKIENTINQNKDKKIKISLQRGTYHLKPRDNDKYILNLSNVSNLTLDGNGSSIIIDNESTGFIYLRACNHINISKMKIDYKYLPKSMLTVTAIHTGRREMTVEVSHNDLNSFKKNLKNQTKRKTYILAYDEPGIIKKGSVGVVFIDSIKHLKGSQYILKYKKSNTIEKGDKAVIIFRYQRSIFHMYKSNFIEFYDNTIYSAPSGVFVARESSNVSFNTCKVLIRDRRLMSTNADIFHFQSSRIGPNINKVFIEGVGDDIINLYSVPMSVMEKKGRKQLLLSRKNFTVKKNDKLSLFDRSLGDIIAILKVKNIHKVKNNYLVEFFRDIPKIKNLNNIRLYNRNCSNKNFSIKNSVFKKSRRFGIYIKAHDGKIVNNTFKDLGGSAISIRNAPNWPEGLNSENILIKENNISNCGFGYIRNKPLIDINFLSEKGISNYDEHKNIRIINNILEGQKIYSIKNVKNITIEN